MKLSLAVLTPGRWEGKVIPITLAKFLIGRDPDCHLRPASPAISKRHCALVVRGTRAFLHDFNSTNGTFLNGRQVKGDVELHQDDRLKVGPLEFAVRLEAGVPVDQATPLPSNRGANGAVDEEAIATLLLSLDQAEGPAPRRPHAEGEGVPLGSTLMDLPALRPPSEQPESQPAKAGDPKTPPPPTIGDTSTAAKAVLDKYLRRSPR